MILISIRFATPVIKLLIVKKGGYLPTFPPATSDSTVPCPAGKFKNDTLCETECTSCEAGKYASNIGQIQCESCPLGKYQDFRGRTECKIIACKRGTYRNAALKTETGLTSTTTFCKDCPAGKHTYDKPEQTVCDSNGTNFEFDNYDVVRRRLLLATTISTIGHQKIQLEL